MSKEAYEFFRAVIHTTPELYLETYLKNPDAPYKDILLSCMADNNVEISGEFITFVSSLLSDEDISIARSAALAMFYGGAESAKVLEQILPSLNDVRQGDLRRLFDKCVALGIGNIG